jgi:hypothetical protein
MVTALLFVYLLPPLFSFFFLFSEGSEGLNGVCVILTGALSGQPTIAD